MTVDRVPTEREINFTEAEILLNDLERDVGDLDVQRWLDGETEEK